MPLPLVLFFGSSKQLLIESVGIGYKPGIVELILYESPSVESHSLAHFCILDHWQQLFNQIISIAVGGKYCCIIRQHNVLYSAHVGGDNRHVGCLRLNQAHGRSFV